MNGICQIVIHDQFDTIAIELETLTLVGDRRANISQFYGHCVPYTGLFLPVILVKEHFYQGHRYTAGIMQTGYFT